MVLENPETTLPTNSIAGLGKKYIMTAAAAAKSSPMTINGFLFSKRVRFDSNREAKYELRKRMHSKYDSCNRRRYTQRNQVWRKERNIQV